MITDFFTNPLQGALFKKLRVTVIGLTPFPMEERVGNNGEFKTINKDILVIGDKKQNIF